MRASKSMRCDGVVLLASCLAAAVLGCEPPAGDEGPDRDTAAPEATEVSVAQASLDKGTARVCAAFRVPMDPMVRGEKCKSAGSDPGQVLKEVQDAKPAYCEQNLMAGAPQEACKNESTDFVYPSPEGVTPQGWVASASFIQHYFRFGAGASMAVYESSLARMEEVAAEVDKSTRERLEEKQSQKWALRGRLGESLRKTAEAAKGPLIAELASKREKLDAVLRELEAYQAQLRTLEAPFSQRLAEFTAFKATEVATVASLQDIAHRASMADVEALAQLQVELVNLSRVESAAPQALKLEASRLLHQLSFIHGQYTATFDEYADFLAENGVKRVDLASRSSQVLQNIRTYVDARYARVSEAVAKTLQGIQRRQTALVAQRTDAATRESLAAAGALEASRKFLADATARTQQLWKLPTRSTVLKLSFLAAKHGEHESLLQLEPVCAQVSATSTPWMESGCVALRREFGKARTYLQSTLPGLLRINVSSMRRAGVSEVLLKDVETKLADADLRQAVLAHDAALLASERK